MIKLVLIAALMGLALAAPSGYRNDYEASVNNANGLRQAHVNNVAEHYVGSGIGTADYAGVPGTGVRKNNYGYHNTGYNTGYNNGFHGAGYNTGFHGAGYNTGFHGAVGYNNGFHNNGYHAAGLHNNVYH